MKTLTQTQPETGNSIAQKPFLNIHTMSNDDILKFVTSRDMCYVSQRVKNELAQSKGAILFERMKQIILEYIYLGEEIETCFSTYLSEKLNYNYTYLTAIFIKREGISLQKYLRNCKIERVKELIQQNELSFKGISYLLRYSSLAHLSNQFKMITGMTPSSYKASLTRDISTIGSKPLRKIALGGYNGFERERVAFMNPN